MQMAADKAGIDVSQVDDTAETLQQVRARQEAFLSHLRQDVGELSSPLVLCVSHGAFIKRFFSSFCGVSTIEKIHNCSISAVKICWAEEGDGIPVCSVEDGYHLVNSVAHIPEGVLDSRFASLLLLQS